MERNLIMLLAFVGLFSCNNKKTDVVKELQDSLLNIPGCESFQQNGNITIVIYDTLPCLFDALSDQQKMDYINKHHRALNKDFISHYDRYSTIANNDSIFNVLMACDFSPQTNRELVPFYIHVLTETLKNENVDGYVGEALTDICYSLFKNFPGYFYQCMNLMDKSTKTSLMNNISIGIYYDGVDKQILDSIFKQHAIMLPNQRERVLNLEKYVGENNESYN